MKTVLTFIFFFALTACVQNKNINSEPEIVKDTVLVKKQNLLTPDEMDLYSKSNVYYWLVDKDTLNFAIYAYELQKDSTLHLSTEHKYRQPVLFTTALQMTYKCLPLIQGDFDTEKLASITFDEPIYYTDLTKQLHTDYNKKFGRKKVNEERLNEFLMNSSLTTELNDFLLPLNKRVEWYNIENLHILSKTSFKYYLPDTDLSDYPEYTIAGNGISVYFEDK